MTGDAYAKAGGMPLTRSSEDAALYRAVVGTRKIPAQLSGSRLDISPSVGQSGRRIGRRAGIVARPSRCREARFGRIR